MTTRQSPKPEPVDTSTPEPVDTSAPEPVDTSATDRLDRIERHLALVSPAFAVELSGGDE